MKLVLYEWKKLWKNASVLKIVLFFVILSGVVFWGEIAKDREWTPAYLQMHAVLDEMDIEDAKKWIVEEKERRSTQEDTEFDRAFSRASEYVEKELEALGEYEAYREAIQNRYEQNQSISIFADEAKDVYMGKIASKYEQLSIQAPMKLKPYAGVQKVLESYVGDVLAIVLLLYLVSVVFIQEEKSGKTDFACTMVRGNRALFFAKAATVYGSMLMYLIGIFLLNMALANIVYGEISFSMAVQSVPEFYAVPYAWTIGQYLLVAVCMKGMAAVVLTALTVFLAKWRSSEIQVSFLLIFFLGISMWAGNSFVGDGMASVFRIWNVWSLLRGMAFIRSYELIRILGGSFQATWGIPVLLTVSGACLFFAGFHSWKERKRRAVGWKRREKKPHNIFFYEMKKLWIHQGAIVLFLVCILVQISVVFRYENRIDQDEFYYQKYIDTFGGRITDETDAKVANEEERLQKVEEELVLAQDSANSMRLSYELERRGGFAKYTDRINALREDGREKILLKDAQYRLLFENTEVSRMFVILLCTSFAFLIPAVFHKEKDTKVEMLQKTSVSGGKRLWLAKIGSLLIYSSAFWIAALIFTFFKVSQTYEIQWSAPLECLGIYWNSKITCSVLTAWIVGVLLQCVIMTVMVILLSACAERVKNQYVMTGILLGGSVVPTVLAPYSTVGILQWVHDFFFVFSARSIWVIGSGMLAVVAAIVMMCRGKLRV